MLSKTMMFGVIPPRGYDGTLVRGLEIIGLVLCWEVTAAAARAAKPSLARAAFSPDREARCLFLARRRSERMGGERDNEEDEDPPLSYATVQCYATPSYAM